MNKHGETSSLPATVSGPKPGDFALGSAESRAAARALVQRFKAEQNTPQPGDIHVNLGFLTPKRQQDIWQLIQSFGPDRQRERVPGQPLIWFKWPKGFTPKPVQKNTPPLTFQNATEDLIDDVLGVCHDTFRKAKQEGKTLPPHLDPDLVWNGMAYVPKPPTGKVAR